MKIMFFSIMILMSVIISNAFAQNDSSIEKYNSLFPQPLNNWTVSDIEIVRPEYDMLSCNDCLILSRIYHSAKLKEKIKILIETESFEVSNYFLWLSSDDELLSSLKKNLINDGYRKITYQKYEGYEVLEGDKSISLLAIKINIGAITISYESAIKKSNRLMDYLKLCDLEGITEFILNQAPLFGF